MALRLLFFSEPSAATWPAVLKIRSKNFLVLDFFLSAIQTSKENKMILKTLIAYPLTYILGILASRLYFALFPLLALTLISCGQDNSGSGSGGGSEPYSCETLSQIGEWQNQSAAEILTIYDDCTAVSDLCSNNMSFTLPAQDSGSTTLYIDQSNGGSCPAVGEYDCFSTVVSDVLVLECDGLPTQYFDRI